MRAPKSFIRYCWGTRFLWCDKITPLTYFIALVCAIIGFATGSTPVFATTVTLTSPNAKLKAAAVADSFKLRPCFQKIYSLSGRSLK